MMFQQQQKDALLGMLATFSPDSDVLPRSVALYSASIALADPKVQESCLERAGKLGVQPDALYEVVLQSYLFLGFPRMLQAAELFHRITDKGQSTRTAPDLRAKDLTEWINRGEELCRRVYANKFEPLQRKVSAMAPEVFQWMIAEGYGKVLSRPSLDLVSREMAVIACLMIENHQPQLRSHILGAINVGATNKLIFTIIADLNSTAEEGAAFARTVLEQVANTT